MEQITGTNFLPDEKEDELAEFNELVNKVTNVQNLKDVPDKEANDWYMMVQMVREYPGLLPSDGASAKIPNSLDNLPDKVKVVKSLIPQKKGILSKILDGSRGS